MDALINSNSYVQDNNYFIKIYVYNFWGKHRTYNIRFCLMNWSKDILNNISVLFDIIILEFLQQFQQMYF